MSVGWSPLACTEARESRQLAFQAFERASVKGAQRPPRPQKMLRQEVPEGCYGQILMPLSDHTRYRGPEQHAWETNCTRRS
jgi:hypothetical protein